MFQILIVEDDKELSHKEECLYTTNTTPESNEAREIRRLNQLLNEKDKEIAFLKKAAAFFAKEID